MRLLFSLTLVLVSFFSLAQNKVCFTIDDLPVVSYGITDSTYLTDLTNRLVRKLNDQNVPAIGFVNERKLYNNGLLDPVQSALLKTWIDHGLELGNHTFSHIDYNTATTRVFTDDLLRGEKITRELQHQNLRYFRHPYLHTGNTKPKSDSLESFLKQHEYIIAPVTVDNDDYLFAAAYHRTKVKKDEVLLKQIVKDYIIYMEKKIQFYEKMSRGLFGRNITHILLLHANELNADHMELLVDMYKMNNYSFVTLEEALRDKAYETQITRFGNWGISWIDRWALSAGKPAGFFAEDPATPEYIVRLSRNQ